jgi:Zn finger protein HypA/HybF involved in hydrogenase expression
MIKYITMEEGLNLKKHIPMSMDCKKCGKKTKHTHKETEKLHIYKCSQCNNVKWDRRM